MTMGNWKIGKALTVLLALVLCLTAALPGVRASAQTEYLSGDWEEATLEDEDWIWTVYAFRFDSTLYDCTAFDLEMEVTMNYGARCKNWDTGAPIPRPAPCTWPTATAIPARPSA